MIRLLLTMLAVLTGVVAQLAPAQSRTMGVSEVAIEIGGAEVRRVERRTGPALPVATSRARAKDRTIPMPASMSDWVPTVRQGIDRARE